MTVVYHIAPLLNSPDWGTLLTYVDVLGICLVVQVEGCNLPHIMQGGNLGTCARVALNIFQLVSSLLKFSPRSSAPLAFFHSLVYKCSHLLRINYGVLTSSPSVPSLNAVWNVNTFKSSYLVGRVGKLRVWHSVNNRQPCVLIFSLTKEVSSGKALYPTGNWASWLKVGRPFCSF